jgi:starvation-inducible DNA-binding protein
MTTKIPVKELQQLLADTYCLYLKTQNYHWHVKGPNFKQLHDLFEDQYKELALMVDTIAERILILGGRAPATFKEFAQLTTLSEGKHDLSAEKMIAELSADQQKLIGDLNKAVVAAQAAHDEGTASMASELIEKHEKARWFLENHLSK